MRRVAGMGARVLLAAAVFMASGCGGALVRLAKSEDWVELDRRARAQKQPPRGKAARAWAQALVELDKLDEARALLLRDFRSGGQEASLLALADLERGLGLRGIAAAHYTRLIDINLDTVQRSPELEAICELLRERAQFTIVAMSNAVNISDGMDGLSAGLLIISYSAFMLIAIMEAQVEISILLATVVGALIAYLYFNIKPARIQMGDTGSLAMGALLATTAFLQDKIFLLPIIGLPFVVEIGSSLIQSLYKSIFRRRLFKMAPLHLHFLIKGWTEEKTVMRFWLFGLLTALIGFWIYIMSI
ncbi:MAG: hypothetical protein R6X02_17610 [Enhygromyxa sp.]